MIATNGNQTPPHNAEIERYFISGLLQEPETYPEFAAQLRPDDFHVPACREAFSGIRILAESGKPFDLALLGEELRQRGRLDEAGGVPGLIELLNATPHNVHRKRWSEIIREHSDRRRLIIKATDVLYAARDNSLSNTDVFDLADGMTAYLHRDGANSNPFPSMTATELDESKVTIDYLVDWLLVRGQPCILAGGKKCLKTNISIDLTLSLSLGIRFLGVFPVRQAVRVALMSGESGQATIQETARRVAASKGYPLNNFTNALFCFNLPTLGDSKSMAALEQYIVANKLEVLIIDPAYLAIPVGDSAANLFEMGALLKSLSEIGQRTGCTIILCHHTRKAKADPFAPVELEDIAWAGFQEFARQWLLIGRRELYNAENGGEHKLWLNYGGSAGHSGLSAIDISEGTRQDVGGRRWDVRVMEPSAARSDAHGEQQDKQDEAREAKRMVTLTRDCQKIRKAMERFPNGETIKRIKEVSRLNSPRAAAAIDALMERKEIEDCDVKKGTRTYSGIKLIESSGTSGTSGAKQKELISCPDDVNRSGATSPKGVAPAPVPLIPEIEDEQAEQRGNLSLSEGTAA